ncbi:MAG TPA: MFS transporter [Isosphaeraceae bacterium]|jgi:MFS family permease|nr:MFS transporter [Isosphaeraceae bacterium]
MEDRPSKSGLRYGWTLVGLLWFCGFFNYADRQAIFSVFPVLETEFKLTNSQLGLIGSSFMVVYALMAPLSGFVVDLAPRRRLIVLGLGFWSLICTATALSRKFWHLLVFRAAEGLGESFYFPASMSILADYHGPRTRSRAMSLHQTSVYAGTVGGGALAGFLGERYGWRSPFLILGVIGLLYSALLLRLIIEPVRGKAEMKAEPALADDAIGLPATRANLARHVLEIVTVPSACALLAVFAGANFVAAVMLTWLPKFVYSKFATGLGSASMIANLLHLASLAGALCGGPLADWAARRPGGRVRVQAFSLLLGAPCVLLAGWTARLPVLMAALIAAGLCKGFYDANIFASIYDVVRIEVRGTAAGLMNTIGWAGASLAPLAVGLAADRYGLSVAMASTSAVYLAAGLLALGTASLRRQV